MYEYGNGSPISRRSAALSPGAGLHSCNQASAPRCPPSRLQQLCSGDRPSKTLPAAAGQLSSASSRTFVWTTRGRGRRRAGLVAGPQGCMRRLWIGCGWAVGGPLPSCWPRPWRWACTGSATVARIRNTRPDASGDSLIVLSVPSFCFRPPVAVVCSLGREGFACLVIVPSTTAAAIPRWALSRLPLPYPRVSLAPEPPRLGPRDPPLFPPSVPTTETDSDSEGTLQLAATLSVGVAVPSDTLQPPFAP